MGHFTAAIVAFLVMRVTLVAPVPKTFVAVAHPHAPAAIPPQPGD